MHVPKKTEPSVRKGKRSLLECRTRCKYSMESTHYSVKVKLGIKVIKLVKSPIGKEVTVTGRAVECQLTFARGALHIVLIRSPYRPSNFLNDDFEKNIV